MSQIWHLREGVNRYAHFQGIPPGQTEVIDPKGMKNLFEASPVSQNAFFLIAAPPVGQMMQKKKS